MRSKFHTLCMYMKRLRTMISLQETCSTNDGIKRYVYIVGLGLCVCERERKKERRSTPCDSTQETVCDSHQTLCSQHCSSDSCTHLIVTRAGMQRRRANSVVHKHYSSSHSMPHCAAIHTTSLKCLGMLFREKVETLTAYDVTCFFPLGGDRILWFRVSHDITWWRFLRQYNAIQHHGLQGKCNLCDAITVREIYWSNHYIWGFTVYSVVVLEYSLLKGLILFIPVYNIVLSVHTLDVQFLFLPFIALKSLTVNSCKKKNLPVLHDGNTWRNSPRPRLRQSSVA